MPTPSRISACLTTLAVIAFSTAVTPVCSSTSRSRICSRPEGSFRKYDLPSALEATFSRKARFTSCPRPTVEMVTWLACASLVSVMLSPSSEIPSVSSTMCLYMAVCGTNALVGLGQRGRDLGAAIGRDAGDQLLDGGAILGLADGHGPLEGVVEDEDADGIDGRADSPPRRWRRGARVRSCGLPWRKTCR